MLTSNDLLGYVLTRGGGKLSNAVYPAPPPDRISEIIDNTQILLHHLLQEYLLERARDFISVNLRCLLQTFSLVTYWQGGGGGQAVQDGLSCPLPRIVERIDNTHLLHNLLQEYLVERDVNFISVNLRCLPQTSVGLRIDKGWGGGQVVQGGLSCPPPPVQNFRDN